MPSTPKEIVGQLSVEDLLRWRMVIARKQAIEVNPDAYSAKEVEAAILDYYQLSGELVERYGLDDSRHWIVTTTIGLIYYDD